MRTALLDANVLYSAALRDLLLQLARAGLYQAKWSNDIHREWIEALLRTQPSRNQAALHRTRQLMDQSIRGCLVTGYEPLISGLTLPDACDRHVLAAAIVGRCDVIVTHNLAHFPVPDLEPFGIEARPPDEFLLYHLNRAPDTFCEAVRQLRARLINPPYTVDEYLRTLMQQGLMGTAMKLLTLDHLL